MMLAVVVTAARAFHMEGVTFVLTKW